MSQDPLSPRSLPTPRLETGRPICLSEAEAYSFQKPSQLIIRNPYIPYTVVFSIFLEVFLVNKVRCVDTSVIVFGDVVDDDIITKPF
jgi:hypothetical protein